MCIRDRHVQVVEVDDVARHRPLRLLAEDRGDAEDRLRAGSEPYGDGIQESAVGQHKVLGGRLHADRPLGKAVRDAGPVVRLEAHQSFPVLLRPSSAMICSVCWPGAGIGPITGSSPSSVAGGTSALIGPTGESTSRQRLRAASCSCPTSPARSRSRALAMPASSSRLIASLALTVLNALVISAVRSSRWATRKLFVTNRSSVASPGLPSTTSQKIAHSRSF